MPTRRTIAELFVLVASVAILVAVTVARFQRPDLNETQLLIRTLDPFVWW